MSALQTLFGIVVGGILLVVAFVCLYAAIGWSTDPSAGRKENLKSLALLLAAVIILGALSS
jgi:hypothetical protein